MPWKECSVVEERLCFVARLLDGEAMTELCREFGISRKTGYKIFDRYKEHGLEALSDRSRRPVRYANQLPSQVESLIVSLKRQATLGRAQDQGAPPAPARLRSAPARSGFRAARVNCVARIAVLGKFAETRRQTRQLARAGPCCSVSQPRRQTMDDDHVSAAETPARRPPWNKGKFVGAKLCLLGLRPPRPCWLGRARSRGQSAARPSPARP